MILTFILKKGYGQEYFKVEGNITNTEKQAIPYANISIKGTSIGAMSNEDGNFILNVSEEYIYDTIVVSHIGYKAYYFIIDKLHLINNKIELSEALYSIGEVSISPIDPFKLIQKAITQIPQNYNDTEYESEGFYREVITENDKYIEFAEGIISVLHKPYIVNEKKQESDLIKLVQSRRKKNELEEYELSNKVSNPIGGPVSCIKYNSIKKHPSFLGPNAQKSYDYKLLDIMEYLGREVYVVEFDQNNDVKKALYKGTIYIDKESLAFIKFNYRKSTKGIKYGLPRGLNKAILKLLSMNMDGFDRKVTVDYKFYDSKWHLNSINYTEVASFIRNEKLYDIISTKNYLTTKINDAISNSYQKDEVLKSGEFKDQIGEYDENFWGNYNIIPLNEVLQKQLNK